MADNNISGSVLYKILSRIAKMDRRSIKRINWDTPMSDKLTGIAIIVIVVFVGAVMIYFSLGGEVWKLL